MVTDCRWLSQGLLSLRSPDGGIKNSLCIQDVPSTRSKKKKMISYLYGNILIEVFFFCSFTVCHHFLRAARIPTIETWLHNKNGHLLPPAINFDQTNNNSDVEACNGG